MKAAIAVHEREFDPGEEKSFLPTRLLDLGDNVTNKKKIHLVLRDEMSNIGLQNAKYATLSYCWGDTKTAQIQSITTWLNLKDRIDSIDTDTLSPVIQDAIEVCSKLSIRYLWVDALCILQGRHEKEVEDWDHESQQMYNIFGNAFVTICAAFSN
ncbi:heterokaryon incompatibility protein-domain-containing protein, partial [Diaporthe sp. PMI_573]